MNKTFPQCNLGLEIPVILSTKLINYYWMYMPGESKQMHYEKLSIYYSLKVTSSGEYFKARNIIVWLENCSYDQLTVIESSKYKSASRNSVVEWFSGLQTSMQWRLGHMISQYSTKWSSEFFLCIMKFKTAVTTITHVYKLLIIESSNITIFL